MNTIARGHPALMPSRLREGPPVICPACWLMVGTWHPDPGPPLLKMHPRPAVGSRHLCTRSLRPLVDLTVLVCRPTRGRL